MNRRAFFGAAALVVSSPVASMPVVSEVEALIKRHETAWERDNAAWLKVSELSDHPRLDGLLIAKVKVGDFLGAIDANGQRERTPKYAHSDGEIDAHIDRTLETNLFFCKNNDVRQKIVAKSDAIRLERKAELAAKRAEITAVEVEVGLSKARETAVSLSDETRAIETKILNFVPHSLKEAALKAIFVVDIIDTGRGYLDDDQVIDALRAIATSINTQEIAA